MARFLHIADIHLGFNRYDSSERTKDFFRAFSDVLQRHAIEAAVDFVLVAGDLFEHRNIQPATLNQAQICLQQLKSAGIPLLAIEGNHDNRPYGTRTSWLKYLSEWGLLKLLEPNAPQGSEPLYTPWDERTKHGGYIDLDCGVRVCGSLWYGATAPRAIEQLADAIDVLPPAGPTLLMFHHGLEGQIARYAGALRYGDLLPLRQAGVDYLALGHIHKSYAMEDWVFNPGSLEANSIEEADYVRGAYLVEIEPGRIQAELQRNYCQRPVVRLQVEAASQLSQEALTDAAEAAVRDAIATGRLQPDQQPVVELRIGGQIGFDRFDVDVRALQARLESLSNALIFLLKYEVEETAYASPLAGLPSRSHIEQSIFTDLLAAHRDYRLRADRLAHGLMDLKDRQLQGQNEQQLYDFVAKLLRSEESKSSADADASASEASSAPT